MNEKAAIQNQSEGIVYMTYDEYEDVKSQMNERRQIRMRKDRERRARYYKRQRILGALIMLVGIICIIIGCFIHTNLLEIFGVLVGVVGLYIIVTPQMVLVDKYYLEIKDRLNQY